MRKCLKSRKGRNNSSKVERASKEELVPKIADLTKM